MRCWKHGVRERRLCNGDCERLARVTGPVIGAAAIRTATTVAGSTPKLRRIHGSTLMSLGSSVQVAGWRLNCVAAKDSESRTIIPT